MTSCWTCTRACTSTRRWTSDPLTLVAAAARMQEHKVLCLDEFFVTDVADATMLNRLFSQMWDRRSCLHMPPPTGEALWRHRKLA